MSISLVKLDRSSNATFYWRSFPPERCRVVKVVGPRAYVQWPASVRTVIPTSYVLGRWGEACESLTGQRMPGWVEVSQLALDSETLAGS